ncbi:hypothetical protein FM106_21805 [Brachybacterium faecium]|nr:hypothetical protein FM106_21805 [Brachybacterium faecium]
MTLTESKNQGYTLCGWEDCFHKKLLFSNQIEITSFFS